MRASDFGLRASGLAFAILCALVGCGGGGSGSSAPAPAPAVTSSTGSSAGSSTSQPALSAYDEFAQLRAAIAPLSTSQQQARLDAFIAAKEASEEGFPLRSGTRAAFVWKGTPSAPPQVAGEFNQWAQSGLSLARIGATDVWFLEANLAGAQRFEYKLVVDGQWRSDPLNRKFSYGFGNSVVNLAGSGRSHLERIASFPSSHLGNVRDVILYLPPGYLDAPAERFPVLYMHDGQNLFDPAAPFGTWDVAGTCDRLIGQAAIKKLIVVGVPPVDRFGEYTHVPDCVNGQTVGGDAADYGRFIVGELKPSIDGRYRTLADRANTGLLGSSLGGLISLWIGYEHPAVFRSVGGMSSTFGWGRFCSTTQARVIEVVRAKGKQDVKVYIDSGGSSSGGDNYGVTIEMRDLLVSQGHQSGVDLLHHWEPGAAHNEAAWRARLEKPLRFWFPR